MQTPEERTAFKRKQFEDIWTWRLKGKPLTKSNVKAAVFEAMERMYHAMEKI